MKLEKCPICSTRMKEQDGRMICQNCGYYQIIDRDNAPSGPAPSVPQWQQSAPPFLQEQKTPRQQTPYRPNDVRVTASVSNNSIGAGAIAGWVAFAVILLSVIGLSLFALLGGKDETASATAVESGTGTEEDTVSAATLLPQSESFQMLVSQVFDVEYGNITKEMLDQVTRLEFYYDEDNRKCISVYLDDGTNLNYYLNEDLYMDMADLSCFKNVSWLVLEYGHLRSDDLQGMESLTSIASDMTLKELYEAVPYPENITYIQINSTIFVNSCDGIDNFPNLTYFSADCMDMRDIGALSGLAYLEGLSLTDCDRLEDFSPLYDLTGLRFLSLESSSLKDIGFVENMPHLEYLSISDADQLMSIEALASCSDTLTELYLEDTWKLSDFQTIETLTGLTNLGLTVSYEDSLPSFASLQDLQYLEIHGAGDLNAVRDAKNLLYLSLDDCNCEDLSVLNDLQSLNYLDLIDMSGYHVSLEPVTKLPALLGLDISESTVYADAAALLSIPTLEALYMEDCNIGLNPENITANESLTLLNMNDSTFYRLSDQNGRGWLQDEEKLKLAEHTDLFANFPNLEQLSVKSCELTDLSFLTQYDLTHMRMLDITDNYVVDMTPLTGLTDLEFVLCEDNPIANTADLDDILVR